MIYLISKFWSSSEICKLATKIKHFLDIPQEKLYFPVLYKVEKFFDCLNITEFFPSIFNISQNISTKFCLNTIEKIIMIHPKPMTNH